MEEQQSALFTLSVDDTAQSHFISIAKWNRFMAIVGITLCTLIILTLVFSGSFLFSSVMRLGRHNQPAAYTSGSFAGAILVYVIFICVYLVPCFYMLSFSNKMLKAIANTDQELFNQSLNHLSIYSTYWGILTIILVVFYSFIITFAIIGLYAMGSH